jgi:hypothetical protein
VAEVVAQGEGVVIVVCVFSEIEGACGGVMGIVCVEER